MLRFRRVKDSEIPTIQRAFRHAMERQQDDEDDSKTFITRGSLEEIWTDQRLDGFIRNYNPFRREDIPRIKERYLQTLSILVNINWDGWDRFRTIFLEHNNRTDRDIYDNNGPKLEHTSFLGTWATSFLQSRYIFCPVDIEEGLGRDLGPGWRLPFLERKKIGQGAYGSVTKAYVAARHLRYRDGSQVTSGRLEIACKSFASHNDFKKEKENLEILREQLKKAENQRIMPFFTTITIGKEFNLFFECADTDLEQFLKRSSEGILLRDLIQESYHLAGALAYLHEEMDPQLLFCHMDLKPANILVSLKDATMPKIGKWIISDFGISIISAVEEARPLDAVKETFRYPFAMNGFGAYQSPETANGSAFGRKSDVWSLGCILVRVLAFGLDGETKLRELDDRRALGIEGEPKYYKHDFFHRGDPPVRNPHIEAWLNELPQRGDSLVPQNALTRFRDLLLHALEINMEDRSTAETVKKDLREVLRILPAAELSPPPSESPASISPKLTLESTPSTTPGSQRPSRPSIVGTSFLDMIISNDTTQLPLLLRTDYDLEEVVKAPDGERNRLLIHAIRHRTYEIVVGFLEARPSLDKEGLDSDGNTPLSCAIAVGDYRIASRLLESGVSANAPSKSSLTPLMQATRSGNLEMVRLLLDHGAECLTKSKEGYTCLHYVAYAPKEGAALIKLFQDRMPIDIQCAVTHETPLSMLIKKHSYRDQKEWWAKFNAFMEAGADVNLLDKNEKTPLYHALQEGLVPVCHRLLERGAHLGPRHPKLEDKTWRPGTGTTKLMNNYPELRAERPRAPGRLWSLRSNH